MRPNRKADAMSIDFDLLQPVPDVCIGVIFVDTTYDSGEDESGASRYLKKEIQSELRAEVEDVDIHPGASLPGWLYQYDLSALALTAGAIALFFRGKAVSENLEAWMGLAGKLRTILNRPCHLTRTAAAALAVDEIVKHVAPVRPKVLVLRSYKRADSRFESFHDATESLDGAVMEYQSTLIHVFEFEVDGIEYLAIVHGSDVAVRQNSSQTA